MFMFSSCLTNITIRSTWTWITIVKISKTKYGKTFNSVYLGYGTVAWGDYDVRQNRNNCAVHVISVFVTTNPPSVSSSFGV